MVTGKSERFEVQFGKFSTMLDAYVLELEGSDMVLGVTWLQRLGKVSFDWNERAINFFWNGEKIKLQGLFPKEKKIDREKQFNRVVVGTLQSRKVTRWEGNKEIISWEPGNQLQNQYSYHSLEDKANFVGEGIDRTLGSRKL